VHRQGGSEISEPFPPLDHADAVVEEDLVQPQLRKLAGITDTVEIEVVQDESPRMGKMKGECRALHTPGDVETAGKTPHQGGLSRAQGPHQQEDITGDERSSPGLPRAFGGLRRSGLDGEDMRR
jgi:hypothetical protein